MPGRDGIAVDVHDLDAGHDSVDALERRVRHIVAVAEEDDVGLPVLRGLHEAPVHHLRAQITHETQRREKTRHVALRERVDLPAVPQRAGGQTHVDARASVPPVADQKVADK